MNIQTVLDERLWSAIMSTYGARNYTGSILDAVCFISDLIREKTGLQCDGVALVGQALGGKAPKLRVNRLETESDKNIQAGLEQMLRGLYQAVRNPRSHGKHNDKQEDADSIILFINYLTHIIDASKSPFTKTEFLARVFDSHFVKKARYAELLVLEVPAKYRYEVMLDVIRTRETGDCKKLGYFVRAMLSKLSKEQRKELYTNISQELKTTEENMAIRTLLQLFPNDILTNCEEAARLRVENILIESIKEGKYNEETEKCISGSLGTWAADLCLSFLQKDDLISALTKKIYSKDNQEHSYVISFFWRNIKELAKDPQERLNNAIRYQLKAGNKPFYDRLDSESMFGPSEWVKKFEQEMSSFEEAEPIDDDNIPF